MLLACSAFALWLHWEPWVPAARMDLPKKNDLTWNTWFALSSDAKNLFRFNYEWFSRMECWDAETGRFQGMLPYHDVYISKCSFEENRCWQVCWGAYKQNPFSREYVPEVAALGLRFVVDLPTKGKTAGEAVELCRERLRSEGIDGLPIEFGEGCDWEETINFDVEAMPWCDALDKIARRMGGGCSYESGKIVLVSSEDLRKKMSSLLAGSIYIWDLKNGGLVHRLDSGEGPDGRFGRFSLFGHGRFLMAYTWAKDGPMTLRTWRTDDWRQVEAVSVCESIDLYRVWDSDDGRRLAELLEDDRTVRVWNLLPFGPCATFEIPNKISMLKMSPDASRLATLDDRGVVHLYDLDRPSEVCSWSYLFEDEKLAGNELEFSPDGAYLLSSGNTRMTVRNARTGAVVELDLNGANEWNFSGDGRSLVGTNDGKVREIWDVQTRERMAVLPPWASVPDAERVRDALGLDAYGEDGPLDYINDAFSPFGQEDPPAECPRPSNGFARFSADGSRIVANIGKTAFGVWERRRPEWWWGVAWLPEFWLTAVFALVLLWSLRRDWKFLWRKPAQ